MYENSDKSFRMRAKPVERGQKNVGFRAQEVDELYEESKIASSSLGTIEGRVDRLIVKSNDNSSYNNARKVL